MNKRIGMDAFHGNGCGKRIRIGGDEGMACLQEDGPQTFPARFHAISHRLMQMSGSGIGGRKVPVDSDFSLLAKKLKAMRKVHIE